MSQPDDTDLGPMPAAEIEPGEPNPGGVDALPLDEDDNVPADLPVELNPAVDESKNPSLKEGEDTSTKATQDQPTDDTVEDPA